MWSNTCKWGSRERSKMRFSSHMHYSNSLPWVTPFRVHFVAWLTSMSSSFIFEWSPGNHRGLTMVHLHWGSKFPAKSFTSTLKHALVYTCARINKGCKPYTPKWVVWTHWSHCPEEGKWTKGAGGLTHSERAIALPSSYVAWWGIFMHHSNKFL